jgi:2-oxoglutarate ferredoxin oxidoreductase subunit delta
MEAKEGKKKKKKSYKLMVNRERCKACYLCVEVCPKKNFEKDQGFNVKGYQPIRVIDEKECTGCRACTTICPDVVFELYEVDDSA